jgi:hypothetical protein
LLLRNEGQKRDPKIGKKYINLIYKRIREGVQIPLSPLKACFKRNIKLQKPFKHHCLEGFFVFNPKSKNT